MQTRSSDGSAGVWPALLAAFFIAGVAASAQAGTSDASVTLKKDSNGLFTLTITDPDGIKSFSLVPVDKAPYGGEIPKCPRTFQNTNVLFHDSDFTPIMPASIVDCHDNTDELEIPPPEAGATKSRQLKPPPPPPAPPPAATPPPAPSAAGGEVPSGTRLAASDAEANAVKAKLSYPITELGNCGSEAACQAYCEELPNIRTCVAYGETHGLMTAEEANLGRRFAEIGGKGPGGCTNRESCAAYCEDISHIDECLDFAQKNGFLSGKELEEVQAVAKARREGVAFPGGCTSKAACEAYCGEKGREDECLDFAERSGLLPPEELAMAKKMLPLIKEGKTPGGCRTKDTCETYCQEPTHMRKCLAFAEEQNLIPADELEMAKKFLPLMEKGETPGGCRSKETCETYCDGEGHLDECVQFGVKAGFISEADAEIARKTGGKGPGDCKSREACESFCKQPENQETCTSFAREHGIEVSGPGGCKDIEECRSYCQDPAHQGECEGFAKERGINITGPGGCQGKDQCQAFCQDPGHSDECNQFLKEQGAEFSGPGGCKSPEECQAYCKDHQQECQEFGGGEHGGPPGGGGGPGGGSSGGTQGPRGGGEEHGGFAECGIVTGATAQYVCAINGEHARPGVETTYFNECHAKQHGAEILHQGVCEGHKPCSDIADPVCGNDNNSWVSACYAEAQGGGVQYKGVCHRQPESGPGEGSGGGPGGCRSEDECRAYCQAHYTDPACGGFGGGGGGTPPSPTPPPPLPPPPPPAQSCVPPPSGLVSWWKGESDGQDSVGGNNGALSGGVSITSGKVGNAFKFGGNGSVGMGNPGNLNFGTGPFSLEAWFQWDGGSGVNNIIRKSDYPASGPGSGYWLRVGNGTLEFSIGATTGPEGQTIITAPVSAGAWHLAIGAKDSSGGVHLYVDGQSTGNTVRQAASANSTSGTPFTLGAWNNGGTSEFFSGLIDEVAVYNRALSASEAQAIFSAGSDGKCSTSSSSGSSGGNYSQPQFDCSSFGAVPKCSYVGPEGSQNYNYCKQCYPER